MQAEGYVSEIIVPNPLASTVTILKYYLWMGTFPGRFAVDAAGIMSIRVDV
ncbi:hypothetical protein hrd7_12860 [Leptolinea sp. HRD-7]|nr:hypothetical protein hrd7_12860 [Leptolinea sp. HRD-7]